jgi:hypothetical protein
MCVTPADGIAVWVQNPPVPLCIIASSNYWMHEHNKLSLEHCGDDCGRVARDCVRATQTSW